MMDQTDWYRVIGLTKEDNILQICHHCLAETWSASGERFCDECGNILKSEEEE